MRDSEFRGKSELTQEWQYGSLMQYENGEVCIFPKGCVDSHEKYVVDPETVGEWTGFSIKDEKIFVDCLREQE